MHGLCRSSNFPLPLLLLFSGLPSPDESYLVVKFYRTSNLSEYIFLFECWTGSPALIPCLIFPFCHFYLQVIIFLCVCNYFQVAKSSFVPVLFGHAIDDDFIQPHHSDRIFDAYVVISFSFKFQSICSFCLLNSLELHFAFSHVFRIYLSCICSP